MTYFQWVYFAWGPVENPTVLCVRLNEISNHARKAWTSGNHLNGHPKKMKRERKSTYSRYVWQLARTVPQTRGPPSLP